MAKRGRKRKGYFYEEQEQAVYDYINAQDKIEKNKIFNEWLKPAFTKMIESIIRRYKLYPPDECFDETFNDTISFLMTKIDKFHPKKGYRLILIVVQFVRIIYYLSSINSRSNRQGKNHMVIFMTL